MDQMIDMFGEIVSTGDEVILPYVNNGYKSGSNPTLIVGILVDDKVYYINRKDAGNTPRLTFVKIESRGVLKSHSFIKARAMEYGLKQELLGLRKVLNDKINKKG